MYFIHVCLKFSNLSLANSKIFTTQKTSKHNSRCFYNIISNNFLTNRIFFKQIMMKYYSSEIMRNILLTTNNNIIVQSKYCDCVDVKLWEWLKHDSPLPFLNFENYCTKVWKLHTNNKYTFGPFSTPQPCCKMIIFNRISFAFIRIIERGLRYIKRHCATWNIRIDVFTIF